MVKPCSDNCVGACKYCYYYDPGKGKHAEALLPPEVLRELIRQYASLALPAPMMSWQGGEPTLAGLDYFRQVASWQKEFFAPTLHLQNAFQTCGLLLDEDWCRFLAAEKFLIGLSIDGPADLHDSIRVDKADKPTHERAVKAYRMLCAAGAEVNILSVISSASLGRAADIYRHLRELGASYLQFIPCGPGRDGRGHTGLMIKGEEYGQFMLDLLDAWLAEDNHCVSMRTNDNFLHLYFGIPCEFCQYRHGCMGMVTAETDGSLYPCDFFVTEKYCLGNFTETPLGELVGNEIHQAFFRDTGMCHRSCRDCAWYRFCRGGCLRQRGGWQPRGKNMLCESMKMLLAGSFERFDQVLSGRNGKTPNLTRFFADLVRRYGWPRESKLKPPPGVPLTNPRG